MRHVRSLASLSTGFLLTVALAGLAPAASADSSSPEVVATLGAVHRALAAPRVGAAVTVGQSSGFTSFGKCTGVAPLASTVHASGGGATYTMPFAGVLTSYSTRTGPTAGSVRALAFVDGATNHKTLVGKSSWTPVVINTNNTYAIRVPVPAGAKLGIAVNTNGMFCAIGVGLAGDMLAFATYNPDLSNDMSYGPSTGYRPDISAVLEPDVGRRHLRRRLPGPVPAVGSDPGRLPGPRHDGHRRHRRSGPEQPPGQDQVHQHHARGDVHLRGRREAGQAVHVAVQEEVQVRQAPGRGHRGQPGRHRRRHAGDGEVQGGRSRGADPHSAVSSPRAYAAWPACCRSSLTTLTNRTPSVTGGSHRSSTIRSRSSGVTVAR